MRLKIALLLILLTTTLIESKRSRGRSRGTSSGGTGFWNRKKSNESKPKTPVSQPEIKKETSNVQQSAPTGNSGKPIGWNVDNNSPMKKQNVNPSHTASAPYPQQNSGNLYGHNQPGTGYNYNNQPGAGYNYGQSPSGGYNYGQQASYPGYHAPGGYNAPGGYHAPGGYGAPGGYNAPGGYQAPGGYNYPGYGGYPGHSPMGGSGGYGGYGGYGGQSGGMFGNKYGGFGGGYGGYYGMKKSGGFLGKHAFRNVLGGLFVWYLVSGLVSKPYKVYNYYNQPKETIQQEITLPANVLTLCNENATNICVPGTVAICTNDNRILCVTSMTSTTPCQNNNGALCVNSTIPCLDTNDPLCQNKTASDNTTTVNLPCFTNMTLESVPSNITLPQSNGNKYCVTTMAVPDPSMPPVNVTEETTNATFPQIPGNGTQDAPMWYPPIPGNGTQNPPMWYPPPPVPGNGTQNPPMWYPPPPPYWGYGPGYYPPPPYWGQPTMNVTLALPANSTEVVTTEVTTVES